ncbi:MAG TPA: peptidoglycan DD-metalloendopeptidase family protein [Rhodanobacteraceae bacterium]|nr:peptidoglycan DD-metalloendopeptidase family protein [Rhodanobacteraceae bacterium]
MRTTNLLKLLLTPIATVALLAGCASTPAPVVNHSFSPGQQPSSAESSPAQPAAAGSGTRTFGLGHANGTVSAAGYTVAPGDTLYSIAFAHGIDFRTLAAQNNIPPPYVIHPGQVLALQPSSAAAAGTVASAPTPPTQPAAPVFGPVTTQDMTANGVAPASASSAVSVPVAAATSAPPAPVPPAPVQPVVTTTPTPASTATRTIAGITWQWPASGEVVGGFRAGSGGDGAGVDIAGNVGDPVRAAAGGTVVYSGNGLIGYGELVIVKHNDTYLSAYGHNSRRLVKEGQHVDAGQEIALMGASGAPRVELHFEIRKDGKPVDPLGYLPKR